MLNITKDLTIIQTEVWFLPFDIIMIICTSLSIIAGLLFLFLAVTDRTGWSVQMLLVCNSCLAEIFLSCVLLSMAIFTIQQDLKQNTPNISFCRSIGFLGYVFDSLQNYSYFLTAIYRYISVVYPTRIAWQSKKSQIILLIIQWVFCAVYALPLLLTEQITYNIDNQICQIPLHLSVPIIYVSIVLYFIPNVGIFSIYIKLTRYVHQMSHRTTTTNTLFHARRELRLVQRTFILTNTLIILGIPYAIFIFISFFTIPPKYHFRIAYFFADISVLAIMIILYCFTSQIKTNIQQKFRTRNAVEPIGQTART